MRHQVFDPVHGNVIEVDEPICPKCGFVESECMCKEREQAKTDEQEFIETLKTLKGWEWELVAEHMPLDLCIRRLTNEWHKLNRLKADIKDVVSREHNDILNTKFSA